MKPPAFRRPDAPPAPRHAERGVTMVLVALCMMAIIAMAALSIDVVTLYLAREEAQRSADAAALAAARIISLSGITTTANTTNSTPDWQQICGGNTSVASVTAKAVAQQNSVANNTATVHVTYSVRGAPAGNADCSGLGASFAINPTVIVQVTNNNMPTLFSRIWSNTANSVSATAVAEAFNPSDSGTIAPGGEDIPVIPRCVKPWIIPNEDPVNAGARFVRRRSGTIVTPGIRINGVGAGVIGEAFTLTSACTSGALDCSNMNGHTPAAGAYVPALVTVNAYGFPTCADAGIYQEAIGGCDQTTAYECGTVNGGSVDLTINPSGSTGDTEIGTACLINQQVSGTGQDTLDVSAYPYQMKSGASNQIFKTSGQAITASNSVVSLPIYDNSVGNLFGTQPSVTIVGFLQVFVDSVDATNGNVHVHVLNVSGCGNNASPTLSAPGNSPVPFHLITAH